MAWISSSSPKAPAPEHHPGEQRASPHRAIASAVCLRVPPARGQSAHHCSATQSPHRPPRTSFCRGLTCKGLPDPVRERLSRLSPWAQVAAALRALHCQVSSAITGEATSSKTAAARDKQSLSISYYSVPRKCTNTRTDFSSFKLPAASHSQHLC